MRSSLHNELIACSLLIFFTNKVTSLFLKKNLDCYILVQKVTIGFIFLMISSLRNDLKSAPAVYNIAFKTQFKAFRSKQRIATMIIQELFHRFLFDFFTSVTETQIKVLFP